MTRGYVLLPKAHDDLDQIWEFTAERWSVEQADRYIQDIADTFADLAQGKRAGRAIPEIRSGYYRCPVGKHVIFYLIDAKELRIVRVLHQRMDHSRRL
jgi:toxin ParE1/3/4